MARKLNMKSLRTKAQLLRNKKVNQIVYNTLMKGEMNREYRIGLRIYWDRPRV